MSQLRQINLALGERVRLREREYAFAGEVTREGIALEAERELSFKDVRTAAHVTLSRAEFDTLYAEAAVRILRSHDRSLGAVEPMAEETPVARWRRLWCEAYDATPCSKSDAALGVFIAATARGIDSPRPAPSAPALRVWLRERGAAGDRRTRFMGDQRSGRLQPLRLEPLAARVLSEKAEAFYDGVRLNPLTVYCAVRTGIEELNRQRAIDACHPSAHPARAPFGATYVATSTTAAPRAATAGAKAAGASIPFGAQSRPTTSSTWPLSTRR